MLKILNTETTSKFVKTDRLTASTETATTQLKIQILTLEMISMVAHKYLHETKSSTNEDMTGNLKFLYRHRQRWLKSCSRTYNFVPKAYVITICCDFLLLKLLW
jgi:hypothetical protein